MSDQPTLTQVQNKVATLKQWSRDAQIGAIVVTGSGRAFLRWRRCWQHGQEWPTVMD